MKETIVGFILYMLFLWLMFSIHIALGMIFVIIGITNLFR